MKPLPRLAPAAARGQRGGGQLPAETTGFVGRETELAKIAALLGTSRLVTITGIGGVGKTRVALRAARRAAARYPDGARVAELSALSTPGELAEAVAAAVGLTETRALQTDELSRLLRDRGMLLVLDTCEHLVDACAILAETILREAPGVTLLATSRQPLDLPGEATYQIPPLRVPTPGAAGTGGEAIELFAQRAAAAVPGFTVTAENQADVVRLCQRLDGIPLAIELAAIRLRAIPLRQLASWSDGGFSLVTGGRRGTLDRHQTLHSAIAWSYDLCTPLERTLWARLSVFSGPFEIEAVEEVCAGGALPRVEVAETIVRLVDKSVLLREPALPWEEGEATRYRLPGTIREFGAGRLDEDSALRAVLGQFVARYLAIADSFGGRANTGQADGGQADDSQADDCQLKRYRKLRAEHVNVETALEYALSGGRGTRRRGQDGAALAATLRTYWHMSGLLSDGRQWLAKAAAAFPGDTRERALALAGRAYLSAFQGHHAEAAADAATAIEIATLLRDEPTAARGYLYLSLAHAFAGEHTGLARGHSDDPDSEARRRLESHGDRTGLLILGAARAFRASAAGDSSAAITLAEETLSQCGASAGAGPAPGPAPGPERHDWSGADLWLPGFLHAVVAFALLSQRGKEADCAAAFGRALRAARQLDDVVGTAFALEGYAWLAAGTGRAERAAWLLGAAAPLWETAGGRLAGAPFLEERRRRAADAARKALGSDRHGTFARRGGLQPLEQIVTFAAGDADELPGPAGTAAAPSLTSRERQIAELVGSGLSNREIAERMIISKRTVDAHVEHIFAKLGLKSRVQLTVWLRDRP